MKPRKTPIRYWSIKLPKDGHSYGKHEFPKYTKEYLRRRGRALFELVFNHVPADTYNELVKLIREKEKI